MGIKKYIKQKKELQEILIAFIEKSKSTDQDIQTLVDYIKPQNYKENREELHYFLLLLLNISNNFHRGPNFLKNIKSIILCFEELIKKLFSNHEIFDIFKYNKSILLFLIQKQILVIDDYILNYIEKSHKNKTNYYYYLFPEIKDLIDKNLRKQIENEILANDSNAFDSFDEKRQIGENDSYICTLIREDNSIEFITYVNKKNIGLSSSICPSIFETNSFLIENKNPTLIEYAAFFGSIEIFQYLKMNRVELMPSLWLYAIHSKSAEIIHILEENKVDPPDDSYEICLLESIKCHHNDIANYIKNNLVDPNLNESNRNKLIERVFDCSFHYSNYSYFPCDFSHFFAFFYLCRYNYLTLLKLFMIKKKDELERKIISFKKN